MNTSSKVIAHIDLDGFYAAVEEERDPDRLKNHPVAVAQYNPYGDLQTIGPDEDRLMISKNGSLIAVNYQAKNAGVRRNQRGSEALLVCPDLQIVQVPTKHGKADLTLYRSAGKKVLDILGKSPGIICERASIDECYLDLTERARRRLERSGGIVGLPHSVDKCHVYCGGTAGSGTEREGEEQNREVSAEAWFQRPPEEWAPGELLLAAGAVIVAELRTQVEEELGYSCSAGIAGTRLLAKLCSGLHKPAQQTVVPSSAISALLHPLAISKLRGLGGQFGAQIAADLRVATVGDLAQVGLSRLTSLYGEKDGMWVYNLARGLDDGEVAARKTPKSVSCGKTFRGNTSLTTMQAVRHWLGALAEELEERLAEDKEDNARTPQLLTVSMNFGSGNTISRSCGLRRPIADVMADDAAGLLRRVVSEHGKGGWKITDLYLGTTNFVPVQSTAITTFFKRIDAPVSGKNADVAADIQVMQQAGADEGQVTSMNQTDHPRFDVFHHDEAAGQSNQPRFDETLQQSMGCQKDAFAERLPPISSDMETRTDLPPVEDGHQQQQRQQIDENVLAELPVELQRELRAELKMNAMAMRFSTQQHNNGTVLARQQKKRGASEGSRQTLKMFLEGKKPKR